MCDAIERVTPAYQGKSFSHVAIVVWRDKQGWWLIEAYPPAVKLIRLKDFLQRSMTTTHKPNVMVGRVKDKYRTIAKQAALKAGDYIGKKYDDKFLLDNDSYYCAELLFVLFKEAADGKPFFKLNKMTFNNPLTAKLMPVWREYYQHIGMTVPEGKLGINPGAMTAAKKITMHYWEEFAPD